MYNRPVTRNQIPRSLIPTNEVVARTGVGRVQLQYAIKWLGIVPIKKKKHGRNHNFYTEAQVRQIKRARKRA